MSFRMSCPKCGTRNYSITRDIRTSSAKDPVSGLIFACRCGKQMYGQMVIDEYENQLAETGGTGTFSLDPSDRAGHAKEEQKERLRAAFEYRREYVAKKREEEAAAAQRRKDDEDRRWRERVARSDGPANGTDNGTSEAPSGDYEVCAWRDCEKPQRPRSKYCSRECSNKNARHRHKQRKREDVDVA